MSTMVERVARTIVDHFTNGNEQYDALSEYEQITYRACARAAIEAMMEPTTWMLSEAVEIAVEQDGNVSGNEYWHRMIQAALKEADNE